VSQSIFKICLITTFLLIGTVSSNCQTTLPEELKEGTIPEQLKYLDDHSRIYENYRAIREDMYRTFSRNTLDTLKNAKSQINGLVIYNTSLKNRIDSLNKSLEVSVNELNEKTRTKNSIGVLGLEVNKKVYNTLMWLIVAVLVFLLITGFLSFKQNRIITLRTRNDLNALKKEFEDYHTKTRLEREKMNIEHFNEIKKLKGIK